MFLDGECSFPGTLYNSAPPGVAGGMPVATITLTALFQSALDLFDLAKINAPPPYRPSLPPSHPRHRRPAALLQEGGRTPTQIMASRQMYALAQSSTEMGSFIRPHCKSPFILFVCLTVMDSAFRRGPLRNTGQMASLFSETIRCFISPFFFKYIFLCAVLLHKVKSVTNLTKMYVRV